MSDPQFFTPEEDITEEGPDGVARLVAPAGVAMPYADAVAKGYVKEPKAAKPSESKPAADKAKEAK